MVFFLFHSVIQIASRNLEGSSWVVPYLLSCFPTTQFNLQDDSSLRKLTPQHESSTNYSLYSLSKYDRNIKPHKQLPLAASPKLKPAVAPDTAGQECQLLDIAEVNYLETGK